MAKKISPVLAPPKVDVQSAVLIAAAVAAVGLFGYLAFNSIIPLYRPGQTLNPTCRPGEAGCTVGVLGADQTFVWDSTQGQLFVGKIGDTADKGAILTQNAIVPNGPYTMIPNTSLNNDYSFNSLSAAGPVAYNANNSSIHNACRGASIITYGNQSSFGNGYHGRVTIQAGSIPNPQPRSGNYNTDGAIVFRTAGTTFSNDLQCQNSPVQIDSMILDYLGNLGVGNFSGVGRGPRARLEVLGGDVYISDIGKGVIMKKPDGGCARGVLDNSNNLTFTNVTCP